MHRFFEGSSGIVPYHKPATIVKLTFLGSKDKKG